MEDDREMIPGSEQVMKPVLSLAPSSEADKENNENCADTTLTTVDNTEQGEENAPIEMKVRCDSVSSSTASTHDSLVSPTNESGSEEELKAAAALVKSKIDLTKSRIPVMANRRSSLPSTHPVAIKQAQKQQHQKQVQTQEAQQPPQDQSEESEQSQSSLTLQQPRRSLTAPLSMLAPSPVRSTVPPTRLGMTARVTPQALEKKVHRASSSSDITAQRLTSESVLKVKKIMTTAETRRASSLAVKSRLTGSVDNRRTSPAAASSSKVPVTKRRHIQLNESPELRRASLSSQSSTSSVNSGVSSASSSAALASRLQRTTRSGGYTGSSALSTTSSGSTTSSVTRGRSNITSRSPSTFGQSGASSRMLNTLWPTDGHLTAKDLNEFTLDESAIQDLKMQHAAAEQGIQEILKYTASTSSVNVKARQEESKLLKSSLSQLVEHSKTLMRACEVFDRQNTEHQQSVDASEAEVQRLLSLLAENEKVSGLVGSDFIDGDNSPTLDTTLDIIPPDDDEIVNGENAKDVGESESNTVATNGPAAPYKMDSPLSSYVNDMLKRATEKIEDKWKARFAEQLAEHEQALSQERERSSVSVMSNSRLVTETIHGKEDELKAVREENYLLCLEKKQLEIDMDALQKELEFMRQQLHEQDEEKNSSAHSFWEKTTDLAKKNRALTEEVAQCQQTIQKLNESIKDLSTNAVTIKTENEECVRKMKEMETEKNLLADKLTAVEAKFDDEKARREQFQVNVEQLTVENTALYAQMVALQTTHEAKMEELRAQFEKRNVVLAGEMRLLQTQNRLMRGSEPIVSNRERGGIFSQEQELNDRLKEMTDELLATRQELTEKIDLIAELEKKIGESELVRRKLHNTIQELRGNIRVHVRLRPFLRSDGDESLAENPKPAIRCDTFASTLSTNVEKPHTFAFDKIYGQSDSQEAVFHDVSDFIQSAMDGYNVCIFAYGQTGSGKTHTMQGSGKAQMRGIIPRSLQLIIQCCEDLSAQGWNYSLDVNFYEIYNETIRDLLSTDGMDDGRKYQIRTDKRGKNYVEGLRTFSINFDFAEEQLEDIVNLAACNRSVDKTDMNAHSSRSHSIFSLTIRGSNEAQNTEMEGSLSLVDLAGSERLSRSNATGDRLKEAQAINKSLSSLADVFQALAKKSSHVPYRNSKLTYVLQPALSGDGKTLMMVNLSPTYASLDESLCSMRFAQNVSQCELGAPTRQIKSRAPPNSSNGTATPSSSSGNSVNNGTPLSNKNSPVRSIPVSVTRRANTPSSITKKLFQ